jgi:Pyruvate/2-oxoacid:ferredoxin oxidoreductase delta subunit
MMEESGARRVIEVNQHIIGPRAPRPKAVRARKIEDYRRLPAVYRQVAEKLSSPLLLGPPICDELMALVQHLFTEEEAGVVRHLGIVWGKTAQGLARAERRPIEQIEPILHRLAYQIRAIASSGPESKKRYRLLPIIPGIYEMVLIGQSPETLTDWHRRFAELVEALYETGFSLDYQAHPTPMVRYLPVGKAIEAHPMALPSDRLEVVLDQFEVFGIGQCQCRMSAQIMGRGCGKPLGNCTVIGQWAERGIQDGWLKQVTKKEVLQIKREAESHGLVTWMMNVASTKGQASCSCCGCCCKALRMVNEFNAPGLIAPPHFLPQLDLAKCCFCGKCARNCPMGAITVDLQQKSHKHRSERCIGCGLCALCCEQQRAILMQPVPDYRLPYRSWFALLARAVPSMLKTSWKVSRTRKRSLEQSCDP